MAVHVLEVLGFDSFIREGMQLTQRVTIYSNTKLRGISEFSVYFPSIPVN